MERQLTYALRQATTAVRAALRQTLADLDLTPVQNTVLHFVAAVPGSSSAELARRMHVTPQTMHKLVADLEDRGLLTLQHRPNHGRILDSHLTEPGRALLSRADACAQQIEDRMVVDLDKRQRQDLLDLLEHCINALDTSTDDHRAQSG